MHKNWVLKGYDLSVTCLADDLQSLVTRSSTLCTPEILPQTNNIIHKDSSIDASVKFKIKGQILKFNLRASICKKNQSNRSYKTQTTIKRGSNSNLLETKFKIVKIIFKLVSSKEGFETKILALVSLDLDERLKNWEGLKIRG